LPDRKYLSGKIIVFLFGLRFVGAFFLAPRPETQRKVAPKTRQNIPPGGLLPGFFLGKMKSNPEKCCYF